MMSIIKKITFCLFLICALQLQAQTVFWQDDLEGAGGPNLGGGTRTPSVTFSSGGPPATRYFFRTPLTGISTSFPVTGIQGTNVWAAEDVDNGNVQTAHQNVTWTNINISGRTGLQFRGLFGTGGATGAFDNNAVSGTGTDYLIVEYRIDGGPWQNAVRFFPISTVTSTLLGLETTGDSIGDGTTLSNTMAEFMYNIPGTGTTMELRMKCFANSLVEEMIIDDFRLFEVPTCSNPTITTQPSNASVCNLGNTSFSISATGATSYQWQVNCGSGFTNVTNGGVYSGATTATLTITGATTGMNGCIYRCLAQQSPCSTTSNNATLTVSNPTLTPLSQTNVACFGGNTGAAAVNPAGGGVSPYTYNWTPGNPAGDGTTSVTGLIAGTWTCTVTDNIGCTASQTFNITSPSAINVTPASQTNVACFGGSNGAASINTPTGGAGGYSYNWTPGNPTGDGTVSVTGLIAGTWTCTVTDANGCTATRTFNITQPPALVVTAASQTNVACNGGSNGAAAINTPTGGAGGYTYNWTPGNPTGDGTTSVTGLIAGTWTCTVTDANSCTATQTFNVTQPPALVLNANSQTNISCNGGSNGAASVTPATGGAGGYTYNWTPGNPTGDGTVSVTGLTAGSWTCTVTDVNGCQTTRTFTLTQPTAITASISSTPTSCTANTGTATVSGVSGGAGGYTYSWAPSGGTASTATGLAAGTFTCTITDANSCSITRTVTVAISAGPTLTAASQTNVSCNGGSNGAASVNAATGGTGPYTYNWTPGNPTGDGTTSVMGLTAGSWTCTVTDANGCTASQTFNITQPTSPVSGSTVVTNVACFGGNTGAINLTPSGGTGPYTFNWLPSGPTTQDRTNLTAGTYTVQITDANGCTGSVTATVTQPTSPVSGSTVVTNVACFGGNTGAINLTPSGGTGPYTFNWLPSGPTTEDRTNLTAGTYTVQITDANGCTGSVTATVTQPTSPVSGSTVVTNVACFGGNTGAINLTPSGGTGPYTFNWLPSGPTTEDRTSLTAGTYTVQITDANGCTGSVTATVTQAPALTTTAVSQTNVSCNGGNNGTATVSASGGTGGYTYSWAPSGGTAATASGLTAGTYTVTVTDANACSATQSFTITEPSALAATTMQTNVSCNGGSNGDAMVMVTGGTASYTYSWAPSGGTNATATGLTAGTYTCTVTDANGCTLVATVTLTEPSVLSVSSNATTLLCNGDTSTVTVTATGGVGPYTGTGTFLEVAGTYNYTITDANGCSSTTSITITEPAAFNVSVVVTDVLCNGDSSGAIDLTVSGGTGLITYSWNNGQFITEDLVNIPAGSYSGILTDANGCQDSGTVVVNEPLALNIAGSVTDPSGCTIDDGSIDVTTTGGTAGYTFVWSNAANTEDISNLSDGTYVLTVTDTNGCVATSSFTLVDPAAPSVTYVSSIDTVCQSTTVSFTLSGATPAGGVYSGTGVINDSIFDPMQAALGYNVITYTYTDSLGCTGMAMDSIFVDVCTDINNNNGSMLSLSIYPNPTSGIFIIEGTTANDVVVVKNALGQVVMNETANGSRTEINLSTQANGVYFVRVMHGTTTQTQRLMLNR